MEGAETEGSGSGMSVDVLSGIGCNIPNQKDGLSPPIGQPARPSPMRLPRARLKARGRPRVNIFQNWDCLLRCSDERHTPGVIAIAAFASFAPNEIGRASCRERGGR